MKIALRANQAISPGWSIERICEGLSFKRLIAPGNILKPNSYQALF